LVAAMRKGRGHSRPNKMKAAAATRGRTERPLSRAQRCTKWCGDQPKSEFGSAADHVPGDGANAGSSAGTNRRFSRRAGIAR
jgi:hypothetical protein